MKILFATDGSRDAEATLELLQHFNWSESDSVEVVSVVPHAIFLTGRVDAELEGWRNVFTDAETRAAEEIVQKAAQRLLETFKTVKSRVHVGFPVQEILNAAGEIEADLIVVGGKGRTALEEWLMGSVSQSVLERAECSVLIGRPKAGPLSKVVIGYDGSEQAEVALQWTARLPKDSDVKIVTAVESSPALAAGPEILMPMEYNSAVLAIHEQQREAARQAAQEASERISAQGFTAEWDTGSGNPATLLLDQEKGADLVIIGAHAKGGFIQNLLGNTARRVAQKSRCPVLVARSGHAHAHPWWKDESEEGVPVS